MEKQRNTILEVRELKTYFDTPCGIVKAVDGVSFDIEKGKVFGIVGESGSGKTLTALSIVRLVSSPGRIVGGRALFDGTDLLSADEKLLRGIRGSRISFVFQEPSSSFNPVFTIGEQITEAILAHRSVSQAAAKESALEHLRNVHITEPKRVFHSYAHQLSGGTKQRAMIAMALVNSPEFMILDEPTTALDVTVQAEVLKTLSEVIRANGLSALFISHNFGVIARMCDTIAVMKAGGIVETGSVKDVLKAPKAAYTASLLESVRALS